MEVLANSRVRIGKSGAAFLRALSAMMSRLLATGTHDYDARIVRRLKILNGLAWLIVISSLHYAVTFALADFDRYHLFVWINIALAAMGLAVPFVHRFHELAGGLLIAITEIIALFLFTALLGREAGTQLNLIVGAAVPFFIAGLHRRVLVAGIMLTALIAHIAAWFLFPPDRALISADPALIDQLYLASAITCFGVIAALVFYAFTLAEKAETATDALLRNVLPGSIVDRLQKRPDETVSDTFDNVSILFTDLTGFVSIARSLGSARTVEVLNAMVRGFDILAQKHGIEKIKTIGDSYMAAAGVPEPCVDHTLRILRFAIDIQRAVRDTATQFGIELPMRIGIACGPVMGGIIGIQKFNYDVWGDAVNLAARLETSGQPGRIHVSAAFRNAVEAEFVFEQQGWVDVKGFGPVETWFLARSKV